MNYLSLVDLILSPIFVLIVLLFARNTVSKNINQNPVYKYYFRGILAKIFGGIAVCLIYTLYYDGGDTTVYFYNGAIPMHNLFVKNPIDFLYILFHDNTLEGYFLFDSTTGWPQYWNSTDSSCILGIFLRIP